MANETGKVNSLLEPCVFVEFEHGTKVEFLVDTGFNGAICLPRSLMKKLGLKKVSEVEIFGVGEHRENLDISLAKIIWFGHDTEIEVLINNGDDLLLGSELLDNKILKINYQNKKVIISDK